MIGIVLCSLGTLTPKQGDSHTYTPNRLFPVPPGREVGMDVQTRRRISVC